jgi:hypothetical protein
VCVMCVGILHSSLVIGRSVKMGSREARLQDIQAPAKGNVGFTLSRSVHTASKHWLPNVAESCSGTFATTNASEERSELWFYQSMPIIWLHVKNHGNV